jgi:hypothetical protein
MSTYNFRICCEEYRYLRERGYPDKAALKLVGDRHRLGRVERNSLFRGVIAPARAELRRSRIVPPNAVAGEALGLDWYNVLITLESYLRGNAVFICDDGIVRDSAAAHGSYRVTEVTSRAIGEIVATLAASAPRRVDAYLDAPIAWSGLMADELRAALAGGSFPSDVSIVHSADYPLKSYPGIVASSDSVVLDSVGRVVDLPALVLAARFGFTPPAVDDLFP